MNSAQVGQSQAESSATGADAGYLLGANPSNETVDDPGFQYGTDPQLGNPQFASSHVPASGFLPQENIPASGSLSGFPACPAMSSPDPVSSFMPASENIFPRPQGIEALSPNPAPGFQYGTNPQFPTQGTEVPLAPPQETTRFHSRVSSPITIDPLLLHLGFLRDNGIDLEDRDAAAQFLRQMGF
ncbi:hypothetical protein MMC07_006222 [Pseudocyphellaria aurata]|nr:hypothetical protein [Pseudocyphellaria aurata]